MSGKRGKGDREPRGMFFLPSGLEGGGFVIVSVGDRRVSAEFTASKIELMLALNGELTADADALPENARGWRSPSQISALLGFPIEEGTLRRRISQINRAFRQAVGGARNYLS